MKTKNKKRQQDNSVSSRPAGSNRRSVNRTTILTTDKRSFELVSNLKDGQVATIECPNDIVSSARNEMGDNHHSIRRVSLLRRAVNGGYRRVRVRYRQGLEVYCTIDGSVGGADDAASLKVSVMKPCNAGRAV